MPNGTCEQLNQEWVCNRICDVTCKGVAWILLQEPGFVGFGAVYPDRICWPQHAKPLDWQRIRDLRLFGETGEWHVWLDWGGKYQYRLLEFDKDDNWHIWIGADGKNQSCSEKSGNKADILPEYHALWGTQVKCGKSSWVRLKENQGTEFWLPPLKDLSLTKKNLPLRLKIKQVVGYDSDYNLAGIVDTALVGLVHKPSSKLLLPNLIPSCAEPDKAAEETSCSNEDSLNVGSDR